MLLTEKILPGYEASLWASDQ